jgi:hypothetical protein
MKMKSAEKVKSNAKMQFFHNSGWLSTGAHDNKNIKLSVANLCTDLVAHELGHDHKVSDSDFGFTTCSFQTAFFAILYHHIT